MKQSSKPLASRNSTSQVTKIGDGSLGLALLLRNPGLYIVNPTVMETMDANIQSPIVMDLGVIRTALNAGALVTPTALPTKPSRRINELFKRTCTGCD